MNTVAFIQARMGSSRLPGKVLMDLSGKSVIQRVFERVSKVQGIDGIFLLTSYEEENKPLVQHVKELGYHVFCGSEDDVLDRYWQAARVFKSKHIIRITGDCPVIDPKIIQKVLELYKKKSVDYCSNSLVESFPDGLDVEVFSYESLKKAHTQAKKLSEREHVTPFIINNKHLFSHENMLSPVNSYKERWTLDTPEDYQFLQTIYKYLVDQNEFFGMNDILNLLHQNPGLRDINKNIIRNAGYLKSLGQDRVDKKNYE